jgi:hypothetical protein
VIGVLFCGSVSARADVFVVAPGQSIQAAINQAQAGDIVEVQPGTYSERIQLVGRDILLRSTDPENPEIVAATIVDGGGAGSVVTFHGSETAACVIEGLTIRNGNAGSGGKGGGINGKGCQATIRGNVIQGNRAVEGGGIHDCAGLIAGNQIIGNTAENYGGGLANCGGIVENNEIANNGVTASLGGGGGLYRCSGVSGSIVRGNRIRNNTATYGGGAFECPKIENNTIEGNAAVYGGGLASCNDFVRGNQIARNTASYYGGGLYQCNALIEKNRIEENVVTGATNGFGFGGGLADCQQTIQANFILRNRVAGTTQAAGGGLASCGGTLQNNIIAWNEARDTALAAGGGLYNCNGTIQNNTVWGNAATGTSAKGGGLAQCFATTIRNQIIWANTAASDPQLHNSTTPSYSCIEGWTGEGTKNITQAPGLINPAADEYHLAASSPCVDAGRRITTLTTDFEGESRPYDGTSEARGDGFDWDMGADEYHPPAQITPTPSETPTPTPTPTPPPTDSPTPTPTLPPTVTPTMTPTPLPTPEAPASVWMIF